MVHAPFGHTRFSSVLQFTVDHASTANQHGFMPKTGTHHHHQLLHASCSPALLPSSSPHLGDGPSSSRQRASNSYDGSYHGQSYSLRKPDRHPQRSRDLSESKARSTAQFSDSPLCVTHLKIRQQTLLSRNVMFPPCRHSKRSGALTRRYAETFPDPKATTLLLAYLIKFHQREIFTRRYPTCRPHRILLKSKPAEPLVNADAKIFHRNGLNDL